MKTAANEFYIGWQEAAPDGISRRVKQFILAVCILVPAVGALLVLNQQGFATSNFEFGQYTELSGVLVKSPDPFLSIYRGKDTEGNAIFQNILLVASGKHGINNLLDEFEKQHGQTLEGKTVQLKGFLIYHDGKTLMEVSEKEGVKIEGAKNDSPTVPVVLGSGAFMGEITDPKCLFGVMKPGYGKPHRSCAARCIAGGIPPVLKTISASGHTQYYLLVDENGGALNEQVLPFVGDQVLVCGEVKKFGDWLVLFKEKSKGLARIPNRLSVEIPACGR